MIDSQRRYELHAAVDRELERAYGKHGAEQWGRHEFYGILAEEVEELWEAIRTDAPQSRVEEELTQVVAMCFRYYETRDRYREPCPVEHPTTARHRTTPSIYPV